MSTSIVNAVCWLHDTLYDVYIAFKYRCMLVLWWYLHYCQRRHDKPCIIYASCNDINITNTVGAYYTYDTIQSTYSLEKWLLQCKIDKHQQRNIRIIFYRKYAVWQSIICTQRDLEVITGQEISDMSLLTLPACKL